MGSMVLVGTIAAGVGLAYLTARLSIHWIVAAIPTKKR